MIKLISILISFFASTIGSICGIGGGVIIKPVLDAFGILDVKTVSFLSGCTVLSMSAYSIIRAKLSKELLVEAKVGSALAIGGAVGGIFGKVIFQLLISRSEQNRVGAVQAGILIIITIGTLLYTIYKDKIKTHQIKNIVFCITIGIILGIISSFLGIGGGPINLVILFYFFSMGTKTAAQNSLYIILFSQITSLVNTIATKTVPSFEPLLLILMVVGGLLGGYFGRLINKKINSKKVDQLFIVLMCIIILINIYNVIKFTIYH